MSELKGPFDLKNELYREYNLSSGPYRVYSPISLWIGKTTHRVLDKEGIVHCIPKEVVITWKPIDKEKPVSF